MPLTETLAQVLEISNAMLRMANDQNIEQLGVLEAQRTALLASLPQPWPSTSPAENDKARRLIASILEQDIESMSLLTPWRDQMGTLLSRLQHPTTP